MGSNEIAVLRDVLVVAAASALVVASLFGGLVAWRLWRLLREARHDAAPVIAALTDVANTVRDTARYVSERVAVPAADRLGAVRTARAATSGSLGARLRRVNAALRGDGARPPARHAAPREDI